MLQPLLVVIGGRPGTGKTTLARLLVAELRAAYLRTDAIVVPILRGGLAAYEWQAARVGYDVAREVAAENLQAGMAVVIDGVNATHVRRAAWQEVAVSTQAHLALLETEVSDAREHRRRVDERHSGTSGYVGPSWETIQRMTYDEWDDERYGPRLVVETSDSSAALTAALGHIQSRGQR